MRVYYDETARMLTSRSPRTLTLLPLLLFLGSLLGCAKDEKMACTVQADQAQSFMAPVRSYPLTVEADQGFTDEQRQVLASAVAVWNASGNTQMRRDVFILKFSAVPSFSAQRELQGCDLDESRDTTFTVSREESTQRWKALGFQSNVQGVTLRCSAGDELQKQAILINTALIDSRQLMSVFVHELGHSIGLDHSCASGAGDPQYRGCRGLDEAHPYRVAVMFPSLYGGSIDDPLPEIKESLQQNDVERATCLYQK